MLKFGKILSACAALLLLSSCYIPDNYRSELRISRFGDYHLRYEGDLIWAPILHEYAQNKITPENEPEKLNNILRDLSRDPSAKKIEPKGKGRFNVVYEREGRLGRVAQSTFLRRDARILMLKSFEDNRVLVDANEIRSAEARRMIEMGVTMRGEFRITTDATVLEHNANEIRSLNNQYRVYIWRTENALSKTPRLVFLREADPARPIE